MDIISQVRRHLTAQCLAHQTGEFELYSPVAAEQEASAADIAPA